MRFIDAEKLKEECKKVTEKILLELGQYPYMRMIVLQYYEYIDKSIDTLQQEQDFIVINKKDWEAQEQFRKNKDFSLSTPN